MQKALGDPTARSTEIQGQKSIKSNENSIQYRRPILWNNVPNIYVAMSILVITVPGSVDQWC